MIHKSVIFDRDAYILRVPTCAELKIGQLGIDPPNLIFGKFFVPHTSNRGDHGSVVVVGTAYGFPTLFEGVCSQEGDNLFGVAFSPLFGQGADRRDFPGVVREFPNSGAGEDFAFPKNGRVLVTELMGSLPS